MQKRSIIVFSLLLISILIISGCQYSAVGGRGGSGISYNAQRDHFVRSDTTENIQVSINVPFNKCAMPESQGFSGYMIMDNICYEYKGCMELEAKEITDPNIWGQIRFTFLKKASTDIPCYQNPQTRKTTRDEMEYGHAGAVVILEN